MAESTPFLVFDFPDVARRLFSPPLRVLCARSASEVRGVLAAAGQEASAGRYAAGFVSYEAAPAFESALRVHGNGRMPLAWFGVYDAPADARALAHAAFATAPNFALTESRRAYGDKVERVREEIARGRTYQVNLTTRLISDFQGDAWALYESHRRAQGGGYHACLEIDGFAILSVSPELFFQTRGRRIRARPMKGTRPRGRFVEEDRALAIELAASEKDRAENLMIVDLLRNDLGRVARTGTVRVTSLFDVERYRTVHQMTSSIEAELADDVAIDDIFAALFPCGSVTGAPKISTMALITELEDAPREVYCGAIGMIEPGGDATFNVAIRTSWIDRERHVAVYGTGAGITYDSDPAAEYDEIVAKASVLVEQWPDFELLETMRAEYRQVVRFERHLARLLDSARYFGIPVDAESLRRLLASAAAGNIRPVVLRLLVDQHGSARVERRDIDSIDVPSAALARGPISSRDRFLFHKTTNRHAYDAQLSQAADCWDVLLWNERGEVTEFTRGNLVVEIGGELLTPPVDCGLLAGTFRAELLEAGRIREGVLRPEDVARASRVWLINSVREWQDVEICPNRPASRISS